MKTTFRKILFVDNSTRCFCIFRLSVAKAFIARGYKVYVMSPAPYDYYLDQIESIGAIHVPYVICPKFSPLGDLKLLYEFHRIYKELKPDYIIHYTIKPNIYGTLAAKFNAIPSLSVVPGTGSVFQKKGIVSKIVLWLYKLSFRFPKKVWVLNEDDYNAFLSNEIIEKERIEILPGEGIDTSYYRAASKYKRHIPFVFLYMGRMLREKGVEYIAEASRILRAKGKFNFEIHLLGLIDGLSKDVISEEEIKKWEQDGLIKFLGSVPDVRKNIEDSDCILLPTFYGEGVPRSLMEACAMERAVLASNNVGCRDIVDNLYNGILCKSQDVSDLVNKMEYMMALSEEQLYIMGMNGREKVEIHFREEVIIQRYLKEIKFDI